MSPEIHSVHGLFFSWVGGEADGGGDEGHFHGGSPEINEGLKKGGRA